MVVSEVAGVARVMAFGISSSVYPTASFAAILAIGKPVAFEASAEERDTRGFISMTTMWPLLGSRANCTLEPPVRSEEHTSELQSLMRISYAVFCLKKKKRTKDKTHT